MSIINVSNLTFAYENSCNDIFSDVSFQIDTNRKLGLCGRNGRGKTTFLHLLMGKYKYSGKITSNVSFEYFPFWVADDTQNTLDVLRGIVPNAMLWEIKREISLLSADEELLYRPFFTLSGGEQAKVLLSGLFLRENTFLLIDEPTNHLDMDARRMVARYLNGKTGFILVSHDRAFLDECTDQTLSFNKNDVEIVNGSFSVWWEQKMRSDSFEMAQNTRLNKDIKRLSTAARQKADWSERTENSKIGTHQGDRGRVGHLAAKMMKRAKTIEKRIERQVEEKSKLLKNIEFAETLKIHPLSYFANRLLSLDRVTVSYNDRRVFKDLSFALEQGDRIALIGENGSGKSTILKMINGEDISYSGQLNIGSRLVISFVPQDASFLSGSLNEYVKEWQIDEALFKAILRKLDFSREQFDKDMSDYSAGQKKKVLLARSLSEQAHLYIWDEPLNFIDVLSRIQIQELILEYEPTLLFVDHDRAFCNKIATKTVRL